MKSTLIKYLFALGSATGLIFCSTASQAAVLIDIKEVGADVIITATGSLDLTNVAVAGSTTCGNGMVTMPGLPIYGAIDTSIAAICIGDSSVSANYYNLVQPSQPAIGVGSLALADSSIGIFFGIAGAIGIVGSNYASGATINSSSTFLNKTLAQLGIGSQGTLGTWQLDGGVKDTITVRATPGPLAVLGVPIAFGWTRRMRRSIQLAAKAR